MVKTKRLINFNKEGAVRGGVGGVRSGWSKYTTLFDRLIERQFVLDKVYVGHSLYEWDESNSPYTVSVTKAYSLLNLSAIILSFRVVLGFLANFFESQPYARVIVVNGLPATDQLRFISKVGGMLSELSRFYYLRWLPGTLTNRTTLFYYWKFRLYRKLKNNKLAVWRDATRRVVSRIRWIPDLIIALSVFGSYSVMVKEAFKLRLPVIGVVDNNTNEKGVWYSVRGNDDSYRSLALYTSIFKGAIQHGKRLGMARYLPHSPTITPQANFGGVRGGKRVGGNKRSGGGGKRILASVVKVSPSTTTPSVIVTPILPPSQRIVLTTLAVQKYLNYMVNMKATTMVKLFRRRIGRSSYKPLFFSSNRRWGRYSYLFLNNKWIN